MCRKRPQILIIDDDTNATKFIQHLLEKETDCLEIVSAESAAEADGLISNLDNLCGVIVDIHLNNGINGLEYAKQLRSNGQRIGIALMSGQIRHEGRFKFIEKPLNRDSLLTIVESMISTWSIREDTQSMLKHAGLLKQELNGAGYVTPR